MCMTDIKAQTSPNSPKDSKRRFIFEAMDMRGEVVHLDRILADLSEIHAYPPGVKKLLGEFLVASVLLASTLKFRGSLTVQARSDRQIPLIMAECSSEFSVRAIARGAEEAVAEDFAALLGGGQLVITMTPERGQRYQGIVPLATESLASSLDSYFKTSEQLQTRLSLASDGVRAAGMLLQQLPSQLEPDPQRRNQQWAHLATLAQTLTPAELLNLGDENLLRRLFHQEQVRLYDPQSVRFRCSCSQDRTLAALATLGEAEIRSILREQGSVTMDCEFCNQRYQFREDDLRGFLGGITGSSVH